MSYYIDIDSTYRDRNKYPNPAQFEVLHSQNHLCCKDSDYLRSPVSGQAVIYPNPQDNEPIAFFEETIQGPYDTIISKENLPYMYATETENIVQLDELPIYSVDPLSNQIVENSLYPRNAIPLGQANNFYTDDYLQDVRNGEYRKITEFRYDDTANQILQTYKVKFYATQLNATSIVTVDPNLISAIPTSNIDRFYQGKYLRMLSGSAAGDRRLIINYTCTSPTQYTFTLQSPFGRDPSSGDTFAIVTDETWYATLESPFSNTLPEYPAFRNLIPQGNYFQENILATESSEISFIRMVRNDNGSTPNISVAYILDTANTSPAGDTLGNIKFNISGDENNLNGFTNTFVSQDVISKCGFGLTLTDAGNAVPGPSPVLVYAVADTSVANNWSIVSQTATNATGEAWFNPVTLASYTNGNIVDQNISAIPGAAGTDFTIEFFAAWVAYDGANYDLVFYDGSSASTIYTQTGIMKIAEMQYIDGNPAIVFIRDATPDVTSYIRATSSDGSTWGGLTASLDEADINLHDTDLIEFNDATSGLVPLFTYLDISPGGGTDSTVNIYYNSTTEENASDFKFRTMRVLQTTINGGNYPIILGIDSITNKLYLNTALSDDDLAIDFWTKFEKVDDLDVVSLEVLNNYTSEPLILYTRLNGTSYELNVLILNDFSPANYVTYRIRKNIPELSGGPLNNLLEGATTNTLILPASIASSQDDLYNGMYIHLTNHNLTQVSTPYTSFNDFLYITDYVASTRTITFTNPLSVSPSTISAPLFTDISVLSFLFTNTASLGQDFSDNSYNFSIVGTINDVASLTDVNNVTLEDVVSYPASLNNYFDRTTSGDTNLRNALGGASISISTWVYLTSVGAGLAQTIFRTTDNASGNQIRLSIDTGILTLEVEGQVYITNSVYATLIQIDCTYPVQLSIDTWYHIVYTHTEYGLEIFLNNVNITSSLTFTNGTSNSLYPIVVPNRIFFGYFGLGSSIWYMKNLQLFDWALTADEVEYLYNGTLGTTSYLDWEILGDMSDSFNPLETSQLNLVSSAHCSRISLTHLILPNVELITYFGDRTAFYPYVYVEFTPSSGLSQDITATNNPHGKKMLFKVPIRDTSTPDRARFVNNSSGMVQTIFFNPRDSFLFSVYLPNGELFTSQISDNLPPLEPNALLQLSATFKIDPITK